MRAFNIAVSSAALVLLAAAHAQDKSAPKRIDAPRLTESTEGPVLYRAHCAVCHGPDGKGVGPMSKFLKTRPSDLTGLTARNNGKFPLARIQKLISGDLELPAGHGTSAMPIWGPTFSQVSWDQDLGRLRIYNLAKYIAEMQKQ